MMDNRMWKIMQRRLRYTDEEFAQSLNAALMMVYAANEMIYAGVDPNEMRFKRASCFDVGLECGGWGKVVLELRVEDREKQRD